MDALSVIQMILLLTLISIMAVIFLNWRKWQIEVRSCMLENLQKQAQLQTQMVSCSRAILSLQQQLAVHVERPVVVQAATPIGNHESSSDVSYHYAIKLLEGGATLEDIMNQCQLSRAEANLLVTLYGRRQG